MFKDTLEQIKNINQRFYKFCLGFLSLAYVVVMISAGIELVKVFVNFGELSPVYLLQTISLAFFLVSAILIGLYLMPDDYVLEFEDAYIVLKHSSNEQSKKELEENE